MYNLFNFKNLYLNLKYNENALLMYMTINIFLESLHTNFIYSEELNDK